jgi:hypothetical protein
VIHFVGKFIAIHRQMFQVCRQMVNRVIELITQYFKACERRWQMVNWLIKVRKCYEVCKRVGRLSIGWLNERKVRALDAIIDKLVSKGGVINWLIKCSTGQGKRHERLRKIIHWLVEFGFNTKSKLQCCEREWKFVQ